MQSEKLDYFRFECSIRKQQVLFNYFTKGSRYITFRQITLHYLSTLLYITLQIGCLVSTLFHKRLVFHIYGVLDCLYTYLNIFVEPLMAACDNVFFLYIKLTLILVLQQHDFRMIHSLGMQRRYFDRNNLIDL